MSASFWLLILSVALPSVIAFVSLIKESQEKKEKKEDPRRWHWHLRLGLTAVGLIVALVLAVGGERSHKTERESDKNQITKLQQSVETQTQNNDKQYERHQKELHNLQDQLSDLKKDIATQDLRRKMSILEGQLEKALADKPKAKLQASLWQDNSDSIVTERYVPVEGHVAIVDFTIFNHSQIFAKDIGLWIRICAACKFHKEPKRFIRVEGAPDSERLFRGFDLPPDARFEKLTVEIEISGGYQTAQIATRYRCIDCEIEDWKPLTLVLGGVKSPDFSQAPKTSSKPKKPPKA